MGCPPHLWEHSPQARPSQAGNSRKLPLRPEVIPHQSPSKLRSLRLFPKQKATRLPITKEILKEITKHDPIDLDELNIDTAFMVAWAGFLRLGEITYTSTELKKASFTRTQVTRSDVSFAEGNQYAVLRLKQSKTDTKHTGVQIVLAATGEKTCPVAAIARLYASDPQQSDAPLFRLSSGAFSRHSVVSALKKKISLAGLP